MKVIFFLLLLFTSYTGTAKNRPYIEVVNDLNNQKCPLKKENIYLSKEEKAKIEKAADVKIYNRLGLRYIIECEGKDAVYLYVDSHIVRTLNETVIVEINKSKIKNYHIASFNEPPEYIAPEKWLRQFHGKKAGKALRAIDDIDTLSGATLTVGASINTVNRILALHKTLSER